MDIFSNNKYKFGNKILDKYQTRAVYEKSNCYLVVAGAGSGKTLTIASKVNYLVNQLNVDERKILCISFTNESVNDMKRVLLDNNLDVEVLTFHKLSMFILKNDNYNLVFESLLPYIITEYLEHIIDQDNLGSSLNSYLKENKLNKSYLENIIESFIHTFKSYGLSIKDFIYIINHSKDEDKLLLVIIFKIYILYTEEINYLRKLINLNTLGMNISL